MLGGQTSKNFLTKYCSNTEKKEVNRKFLKLKMVVAYACRKRANTNYLMHITNSLKLALIITDVNLGIHGVFKFHITL